jgi:hypothetical protein
MTIRLLTPLQAETLRGVYFAPNAVYNPILDALGRYVLSEEEVQQTTNPEFAWVRTLPVETYFAPTPII